MRLSALTAAVLVAGGIGCSSQSPASSPSGPTSTSGDNSDASIAETSGGGGADMGPGGGGGSGGGGPDMSFGGPGPWPLADITIYGAAQRLGGGIVDATPDEAQNIWAANGETLYLLRPGATMFQAFGAADGLHKLVDDLIGGRGAGACARRGQNVGRHKGRRAVDGVDGWSSGWALTASMAGPAGHFLASAEVVAVNRIDHLDHAPRHDFTRRVGIPLRMVRAGARVAVAAAHAQGCRKQAHRSHELVDRNAFQYLNVLEGCFRHLRFRRRLRLREDYW